MKKIVLALAFCLLVASNVLADPYGISLGYGEGNGGIDVYRIGFTRDFSAQWFENETGFLSGYFELSYNHWSHGGDDVNGGAISPVFAYYFETGNPTVLPYVEAGIGVAYIDEYKINNRDLSSHFQFEDRIGVGIKIKAFDLNMRYMHYSNAGIENPNDGIDILMGTLAWSF
ncbi:acyloxyacyl hydrolase [Desulfospira joergensenii]|uniref:acyloxyacyl hydrolase n=1 Tax=Desulfospira joergensenii TaxID=53329 RepID=UPI0003B6F828|nr:acyloxyacyl hydrolase [Desulfospira joergensenii]